MFPTFLSLYKSIKNKLFISVDFPRPVSPTTISVNSNPLRTAFRCTCSGNDAKPIYSSSSWKYKKHYFSLQYPSYCILTHNLLNFLNGIIHLQFFKLPSIIFRDIKMRTWVSQQYKAWLDCTDVQACLALYWLQRLTTFGSSRIRVNYLRDSEILIFFLTFTRHFNENILNNDMPVTAGFSLPLATLANDKKNIRNGKKSVQHFKIADFSPESQEVPEIDRNTTICNSCVLVGSIFPI